MIDDLAEPVELCVMGDHPYEVPAVITTLSAGGLSMLVFAHVAGDTRLKIVLDVPGLEGVEIEGHVVWAKHKGNISTVGVQFSRIDSAHAHQINKMAEDDQKCETERSFGVKDICYRECSYWALCSKPVKLKH